MSGYVDLHCHYLPAVDDGVKTLEDGIALCKNLAALGYTTVIATPHIRTAMFENRKPGLEQVFANFATRASTEGGLPTLGLAAEHFFDDVFWSLFGEGQAMLYPGAKAALVEFPQDMIPQRVDHWFFEMNVAGVRPVLAHPERYSPLWKDLDRIDPLLEVGAVALLDVMSLVDKYGSKPRKTAERMLDAGVYYAACTDCHRSEDTKHVAAAIERLKHVVGAEEAQELLAKNPQRILDGTVEV